MATPSITLNSGQVLISAAVSSAGISFSNANLVFGLLEMVFSTIDGFSVGEVICYEQGKGEAFIYDGTQYFLLDVRDIKFKEPIT